MKMLNWCIFNVVIIKLQFFMIFEYVKVQFRSRIYNLEFRIRILQVVSDPCGTGSTILIIKTRSVPVSNRVVVEWFDCSVNNLRIWILYHC
jgi:hypothetical protein